MTIINNAALATDTQGLSISTSNVLLSLTPVITDAGAGEVAANISDPDHSLNYSCGSTTVDFSVSYGALTNINYVGISGHTASTPAQATVELYNGATLVDSVVIKRNHNIMFTFPTQTFQDLIVKFVTVPKSYRMTVSFIAAGEHLTIPTGEQAGYTRNWLNRGITQRTVSTLTVGPISSTQKSKALKGSLSLPNQSAVFTEGLWQTFIDFSYEQPFFMKEFKTRPESTYLCYDPISGVKSHPQTRTLDVVTLKFTAYNGL